MNSPCFWSETEREGALSAASKLRFAFLDEMGRNGRPVTFSIGVLTYRGGSLTAEELVKRADRLMYSVKRNGKNGIACAGYTV